MPHTKVPLQKIYDRWAHRYDFFYGPILAFGRKRGIEALLLTPQTRVLEVGIGTGLSLTEIPKQTPVVGIDISESMLKEARKRAQELGHPNVELFKMSAEKLDFEDDSFDRAPPSPDNGLG